MPGRSTLNVRYSVQLTGALQHGRPPLFPGEPSVSRSTLVVPVVPLHVVMSALITDESPKPDVRLTTYREPARLPNNSGGADSPRCPDLFYPSPVMCQFGVRVGAAMAARIGVDDRRSEVRDLMQERVAC